MITIQKNRVRNCKPIATKSRRHSPVDEKFIRSEICRLLVK
ncbi:hypothetical protein EG68_09260 [Paragonimus skrjabini miyazakii]|uniref:Uncharacterized protein n=1 Tax=Paragonimus skrjabini miyazakii TaxID=59628 RepID=A0A8S9YBZ2_9TREM|nr:hypothetical protein EG68_09260 [Paragonimus skrjabini miyazakii]